MSTSSSAPADFEDDAVHSFIARLKDFPDGVSPVMVKELRQGLRSNAFTNIFVILQILLVLSLFSSISLGDESSGVMISNYVLGLFSIVAIVLQPLRGSQAVIDEIKSDTLEIMTLTKLSSSGIVYGKWTSLVAQTALIAIAILPYLVMRYFLGGMQLFTELLTFLTIFWISVVVTAVTVGLSCKRSMSNRVLFLSVGMPIALALIWLLFFRNGAGNQVVNFWEVGRRSGQVSLAVFVLMSGYVGFFFLNLGVSRIAPIAENRAMQKRLISLVIFLAVMLMMMSASAPTLTAMLMIVFLVLMAIDVCCEFPASLPSQVEYLTKKGRWGRFAGYFLYPGWHTGTNLILLLVLVGLLMTEFVSLSGGVFTPQSEISQEAIFLISGSLYAVVGPLLIVGLIYSKREDCMISKLNFTRAYLLALSACFIVVGLIDFLISTVGLVFSIEFAFIIPGSCFYFLNSQEAREVGPMMVILCLVVSWLALFVCGRRQFKLTRKAEKELLFQG